MFIDQFKVWTITAVMGTSACCLVGLPSFTGEVCMDPGIEVEEVLLCDGGPVDGLPGSSEQLEAYQVSRSPPGLQTRKLQPRPTQAASAIPQKTRITSHDPPFYNLIYHEYAWHM